MATALELEARGLTIDRSGRYPRALGPPEIASDLAFEVSMRLGVVGNGVDFATWLKRPGHCAHCGDAWKCFGTCSLCELARANALRSKHQGLGR